MEDFLTLLSRDEFVVILGESRGSLLEEMRFTGKDPHLCGNDGVLPPFLFPF